MEKYKKISYCLLVSFIFVTGILLRTGLYIANDVFSDDECRLALSLMDKNLIQSLFFLGNAQSAPPIFILFSKIIFYFTGYIEAAAKFIPYIAGIGALFLFYRICRLYFDRACIGIAGLFIFAVCQPLIAFSTIFKQYSGDVFIACLCLYLLPKIRLMELNKRQFAGLVTGILLLPLISLPSLFFVGAFFIQNLIENIKNRGFYKKFFILAAFFVFFTGLYYIFNLHPTQIDLEKYFPDYWTDGFWKFSLKDLIRLFVINIKFYFVPNDLTLGTIILFIWGAAVCIKEKRREYNFVLLALCLTLLASLLNIYPLSGRVGLYFIPVIMIFILKPLDARKSLPAILALVLFFMSFCRYDLKYLKNICQKDYFLSYSPKILMHKAIEQYNPQKDIIICNSASTPSYIYYSSLLKFYPENVYEMSTGNNDRQSIYNYLNGLEKGKNYIFYLVKDYNQAKIFPYIFEWLEGKKVLYKFNDRDSYLIHLEN